MSSFRVRGSASLAVRVFCALVLVESALAAQYKVGDASGWTAGTTDFNEWASKNTFQVGDSLLFTYHPNTHSVHQVSKADYEAHSIDKPIKTYKDGESLVDLRDETTYYFVGEVEGHPVAGMKLEVAVRATASPSTSPSPAPSSSSPVPSPSSPSVPAPTPTKAVPAPSPVSTPPSPSPAPTVTTPTPSPASSPSSSPSPPPSSPSSSPSSPPPSSPPTVTPPSPASSPSSPPVTPSGPPSPPPAPAAAPSTPPTSTPSSATVTHAGVSLVLGAVLMGAAAVLL